MFGELGVGRSTEQSKSWCTKGRQIFCVNKRLNEMEVATSLLGRWLPRLSGGKAVCIGPSLEKERESFGTTFWSSIMLQVVRGVVAGDFNAVIHPAERSDIQEHVGETKDFSEFIHWDALIDIGLGNAQFTWSNFINELSCSKLDRFFISTQNAKTTSPMFRLLRSLAGLSGSSSDRVARIPLFT
ncbi:hypothetical protein Taro_013033 [Colocasia esculenta]|uniref:Endonuclease/exonuclease/phosphatase domain-containing protein n=1 Tax=Colocasia esculenta TaxID=4460 RepID=A0A843UAX0_COLES|nr:hypothetical protein [Colocasia esculenta]